MATVPATVTIEEIGDWLASQSTAWTAGTNLFLGFLPDKPDTCLALVDVLGFEHPAETMGNADVNVERPQVQVLARGPANDIETPKLNIGRAYKLLRNRTSTSLGGNTHYLRIGARSSPYSDGEDNNSRYIETFTLDVWKEPST
jgi:hypothetical protein